MQHKHFAGANYCVFPPQSAKISSRRKKSFCENVCYKNVLYWQNYRCKHHMQNIGAIYLKHLFHSETKLKGYASSHALVFADPLHEQSDDNLGLLMSLSARLSLACTCVNFQ